MAVECYTIFKESAELPGQGVLDLYRETYRALPYPRRELYVSSPLTSGGARRLFDLAQTSLDTLLAETLRLNAQFIELVIERLRSEISEERITLPHRIGKRMGWGEFDYNRFWLYYLAGVNPDDLEAFERTPLLTDVNLLNNHAASRDDRVHAYRNLLQSYLNYLSAQNLALNPVTKMALMPDYQYSLGCSTELEFAKALGIPTPQILFDRNHPDFEDLASHATWLGMAQDSGETIFLEGKGDRLVILK